MSLFFVAGDLFLSRAQTLAHGCNCKGKMGAGIAREFKSRFPQMFQNYRQLCYQGQFQPGGHYLYTDATPWVLNLGTQADLGGARFEYVEQCLKVFRTYYQQQGITSLALPMIGAGLGGLESGDIRALLCDLWGDLPIPVYVYEEYLPGCRGDEPLSGPTP